MSPRASTAAGRKRATQRGKASGSARRGATKVAPKARPAKRTTPSKPAASRKAATRKTTKAPKSRRAKPAAKRTVARRRPRRPGLRLGSARARQPEPTGRIARIVRPRNFVVLLFVAIGLAAGYRFWLRDSSLVAATHVEVSGAQGPEAARIEAALQGSADGMSTLHVDQAALQKAVAGFPTVAGITVSTHFPHGIAIAVNSRPPVLMLHAGPKDVPVAGDGTLLTGVAPDHKLPEISTGQAPSGSKVTGDALDEAILTGAAPDPLRKLIDKVQIKGDKGVVITVSGLPLIFGTADRADEKWTAVAATLADPKLDALTYLDVRVPDRPAAGDAGETIADAPDPTITTPTATVTPTVDPTTSTPDPAVSTTPVTPDPTAVTPAADTPAADPTATAGQAVAPAAATDSQASGDTGGAATATGGVSP